MNCFRRLCFILHFVMVLYQAVINYFFRKEQDKIKHAGQAKYESTITKGIKFETSQVLPTGTTRIRWRQRRRVCTFIAGLTISVLTCCSSTSGANHASFCALWIREITKHKLCDKIDLLLHVNSALAPDNCKSSEKATFNNPYSMLRGFLDKIAICEVSFVPQFPKETRIQRKPFVLKARREPCWDIDIYPV